MSFILPKTPPWPILAFRNGHVDRRAIRATITISRIRLGKYVATIRWSLPINGTHAEEDWGRHEHFTHGLALRAAKRDLRHLADTQRRRVDYSVAYLEEPHR